MATKHHLTCSLKSPRILSLGMSMAAMMLLTSPQEISAEPTQDKESEDSVKSAFPTLDVLPAGSILRRVRLPRYDEDFVPISLLTAETLTVLDEEHIDGLGITISLYAKDGSVDARTKMRHAIYNQKLSTLHASEAVLIQGKSYVANGTGMVFDWKSNRGFLLGPVRTQFKKNTPNKSTAMNLTPLRPSLSAARSLAILTGLSTSIMAEPPAKLTAAQITELEHLSLPMKHLIENEQQKTRRTLDEDDRLNNSAHSQMGPFLKSIGQGSLLIQKAGTPKEATPAEKKTAVPATDGKDAKPADPKAPTKKAPVVETLKVSCDGGLYFDTDTGILAYLKNIHLTEPRFTLTCTDELKVFLDKKADKVEPTDKAQTGKQDPAGAKKDEAKKDDGLASFGDIKRIIATGKVKVTRKDDNGKLFIATAESASYDAKTGEMILRGGLPRLQLGPHQYLQSGAPGQYIRILGSGKFITEGKWTMVTPTKIDKPKK